METLPMDCRDNSERTKEASIDERRLARKKQIGLFLTFFSLQMALFVAALDDTILATSLPKIGSEFEAMTISSWVVNSYILTFDAFQPLLSKFSDIFGRKTIIMFGLGVFLLGSIICGVSKSMIMLIIGRAVQGIGSAGIASMVYVIIADLVPLKQRGIYEGVITLVFAMANTTGPLIGGSFTDKLTWRWNFYINLPIGVVAAAILYFFLHLPTEKQTFKDKLKRIDYAGSFLVLGAGILFLLAMNFGGQTFPWNSAVVIVLFILSGILIALLAVVEVKFAKEPLIPPRLLKNVSLVIILLVNLFFGITFYATIFYLPVYFQAVRGDSAMWSGIRLIPMQVVVSSFSALSGVFISKLGIYRPLVPASMALLTLAVGLFSIFSAETSWPMIYGITVIGGTGMGLFFTSGIIAVQAAVETRDIAVTLGLMSFVRVLGGALGIAIASAVLNSILKKNLVAVIPMEYAERVLQSPEYIHHGLPAEYFDPTIVTYVHSVQLMWHIIVIMTALAFLNSLFVKKHSLSDPEQSVTKRDGQQQDVVDEQDRSESTARSLQFNTYDRADRSKSV
ncbi:major facilitator superfamily domain-containing protein [Fennellomyces sp. T-0311]|nr:major facilitator superfamily domain-containing protein [Fennellomyces sp. T-0311]